MPQILLVGGVEDVSVCGGGGGEFEQPIYITWSLWLTFVKIKICISFGNLASMKKSRGHNHLHV